MIVTCKDGEVGQVFQELSFCFFQQLNQSKVYNYIVLHVEKCSFLENS